MNTKTNTPVEINVRPEVLRGAAWLDDVRPGWDQEINLATLNMQACSHCIVGQLWGLIWEVGELPGPAERYDEDYGFDVWDDIMGNDEAYTKLGEEWRDLIASRR